MKVILSIALLFSLSACLKTRADLRGEGVTTDNRSSGMGNRGLAAANKSQQQQAQIDTRFFEIDRDFRQLYGKIEVLEKQLADMKAPASIDGQAAKPADDKAITNIEKRLSTLEEALLDINKKLGEISKGQKTSAVTQKPKGPFGYGEMYFSQGKYQEAITSYDQYRKKFPRGRRYAQATLKMGLAFQRLKMHQDAKAFYKEVIQRYPNTKVSQRAQKNLKSI